MTSPKPAILGHWGESLLDTKERAHIGDPIAWFAVRHAVEVLVSDEAPWRKDAGPELVGDIHRLIREEFALPAWPVLEHEGSARAGVDAIRAVSQGQYFELVRLQIALPVVRGKAATGSPTSDETEAANRLVAACVTEASRLLARLDVDAVVAGAASGPSLDEPFARMLDDIGGSGRSDARAVRRRAEKRTEAERWNLWRHPDEPMGSQWLAVLARVLWTERVQREARFRPAIMQPVASFFSSVHQRGASLADDDGQLSLALYARRDSGEPTQIATMMRGGVGLTLATLEQLRVQVEALQSHEAYKLRHYLVRTATEIHAAGDTSAFTFDIEGGFRELARLAGLPDLDETAARLHQSLDALARLPFVWGRAKGSVGSIASFIHVPESPRRRAVLRLTIGEALRPTFGAWLAKNAGPSLEGRMLVPDIEPPTFGRRNDWALQEHVALQLSIRLRQSACELAERGTVQIPRGEWEEWARTAGFAGRRIGATVENFHAAWVRPDGLLLREGHDRYTLTDKYTDARTLIVEAGKHSTEQQARGRRSAAKRASPGSRRRRG